MSLRYPAAMMAALVLYSHAGAVRAEEFPARPVRIVVGFQPGGGTDIAARVIAQKQIGRAHV